ncbi:MAG: type II toxin-antitoxin system PemK/MazF family toxin [Spirochaetes bacterium]|nr:type II toxin-antitoxin system PemK/MazF family toxin [Spirochaetota bacterium]
MIREGKIVLFRFPQTDQSSGKLRPALVIRKLPGKYDDWLICMVSTQLSQQIDGLDELIRPEDKEFKNSGLKAASIFRISRIAVVEQNIFAGIIGEISNKRLSKIKKSLTDWIKST